MASERAAAPSTPVAVAPSSTAPAPSPAAVALAQRQWRAACQRTVRLALTSVRDCKSRYTKEVERSEVVLSELCNALLLLKQSLSHLSPSVLQLLPPDTLACARAKAARSCDVLLAKLTQALKALHDIVDCAAAAAGTVTAAATAAGIEEQAAQGHHAVAVAATAAGAGGTPVFSTLSLQQVSQVLQAVPEALASDFAAKSAVVGALEGMTGGPADVSDGKGGPGAQQQQQQSSQRLDRQLTVLMTAWLLSPDLREAELEMGLLVVAGDMVGY